MTHPGKEALRKLADTATRLYTQKIDRPYAEQIAAYVAELEAQVARVAELEKALAFAACTIKSGEPWTDTCEQVIGTVQARTAPKEGA